MRCCPHSTLVIRNSTIDISMIRQYTLISDPFSFPTEKMAPLTIEDLAPDWHLILVVLRKLGHLSPQDQQALKAALPMIVGE